MKINYFVHTEIGDRPCNEDRYAVSKCPAGLCFALADGLGGLDRGEVAAELACNAAAEYAQAQAVFSNAAGKLDCVQTQRLFDRFYTVETASGSTGLGLSIAHMLVEKMGGEIGAEYVSGRLRIFVRFPEAAR